MTILPRTILVPILRNNISHSPRDLTELWVGWRICKSWLGSWEVGTWWAKTLEGATWWARTSTISWATSGSSRRREAGPAMATWWVQINISQDQSVWLSIYYGKSCKQYGKLDEEVGFLDHVTHIKLHLPPRTIHPPCKWFDLHLWNFIIHNPR